MIILNPYTISSLTGGAGASTYDPLANLLSDNPGLIFQTATTATTTTTIVVTTPDNADSLCLLRCWAATVTLTVGGSAPAGLQTLEIDDAYYTGAKSYWWTFNQLTGPKTFTITLTRAAGDALFRASCVKVGRTLEYTGVQFPLGQGAIDPTVEVGMMDGYVFRGAELVPYRMFDAQILATRATVDDFLDLCRVMGGLPTFWHIEPTWGDYYFLFGRLAGQPSASHPYPTLSTAAFGLREIM